MNDDLPVPPLADPTLEPPDAPMTARGTRRREQMKQACARVLERMSYQDLRLKDIADEADIPISLIYHYFPDRKALTTEVLQATVQGMMDRMRVAEETPADRDRALPLAERIRQGVHKAMLITVRTYADHPGIMRCLFQLEDAEPDFAALYAEATRQWMDRVADAARRHFRPHQPPDALILAAAYALSGMVERVLFDRYVRHYPELERAFDTPESMADFFTAAWMRMLYLSDTPDAAARGLPLARG